MNTELMQNIFRAKHLLEANPTNMSFGIIGEGTDEDELQRNETLFASAGKQLAEYTDFVKKVSYFSLGSIVLFEFTRIRNFQNLLNFLPEWETQWLCIGKIMAEPIGINREDGRVYWFSEIPYNDEGTDLGSFPQFLKTYVFGPKYAEVIPGPDEDEWVQFMIKNELIWRQRE